MIVEIDMEEMPLTGNVDDTPFMTMAKFSEEIEKIVLRTKCSYIEGVLEFCDDNGLDPEDIAPFVSLLMKQKIENDAIEAGMMPRKGQLPI